MLDAVGITRLFGEGEDAPGIRGIDLRIAPGKIVLLAGAVGAGKSTMLRVLAGLDSPDAGRVTIAGEAPQESRVGFVFQDYRTSLLPWRSAAGNVRFALEGWSADRQGAEGIEESVRRALARFGLEEFAERRPTQLSGGQAQKLALARAFVGNPHVLLCDEPFSAMDVDTVSQVLREFVHAAEVEKRAVVLASHDLDFGLLLAAQVLVVRSNGTAKLLDGVDEDLRRGKLSDIASARLAAVKRSVLEAQAS